MMFIVNLSIYEIRLFVCCVCQVEISQTTMPLGKFLVPLEMP